MHQCRPAALSLSASRCCPRTRQRSWMPTSPGMLRRPSRATANRSNHPHGTDPRFQRTDYSRTSGAERTADAYGHLRRSRGPRDRHLRGYSDRAGARRRPRRHTATKSQAAAVHSGTAHGPAHPSHHRADCPSHRADRWREPSPRRPPSALRSVDRSDRTGTRLQRRYCQPSPLPDDPRPRHRLPLGRCSRNKTNDSACPAVYNEHVTTPQTESQVLSLAACLELSENSRLGFTTKVAAQEPTLLCANPQSTLGMHVSLPETRGRSRIQTWNRYAYVNNNPLNNIDPLGLDDLPPMLLPGDGPDDCGYICDSPPISFPFPIPVDGGGGGGGGHPHPPSNPAPSNPAPSHTPSQSVHFPNETNGIPNGLNVNFGGPLGAILPSAICGDLGPCPTVGNSIV